MRKAEIIYNFIAIVGFILFVLLFISLIFSGSIFWDNSKEYDSPTIESFIEKFKNEPAKIYINDYETKEAVIFDNDYELIDSFKEVKINNFPVGTTDNKMNLLFGNPYSSDENKLYLYIMDYKLIELWSTHAYKHYSVSEEDGKRLIEKAKEVIQEEEASLEKERKEEKELTSWDLFVNSNESNYNFSLDNKLEEYKYIDTDNKLIKILDDINHELIDKSVYKPILRYGYNKSDYSFDLILDKDLEKITFRREWKDRYNRVCFSNASYKISKEDGALIYDSLKGNMI